MKRNVYLILAGFTFIILYSACTTETGFSVIESENGLLIKEGESNVLFYQTKPKSMNGEYTRSNYIHPLYGFTNDTLTEDFPQDHPHHRGIFWTWHQIWVGNQRMADAWLTENIQWQHVEHEHFSLSDSLFRLKNTFNWLTNNYTDSTGNPIAIAKDKSIITFYPGKENQRIIDFEIRIIPLVDSLFIGGSEDEKGYGGFSFRMKLPEDISFSSDSGLVIPTHTAIDAGQFMQFKGTFNNEKSVSGITLISHPENPEPKTRWILRKENSMQNVVYPGHERVMIPLGDSLILKYRVILSR